MLPYPLFIDAQNLKSMMNWTVKEPEWSMDNNVFINARSACVFPAVLLVNSFIFTKKMKCACM